MPLAKNYGVRLIYANWRDYPGSTPYNADELEAFKSPDVEKQTAAMQAQGRQIAKFLEYLIGSHNIPPLVCKDGEKYGGISILAWSLGSIILLPFLGHAHLLEEPTRNVLEGYLRTVVLYGTIQDLRQFYANLMPNPYRSTTLCTWQIAA